MAKKQKKETPVKDNPELIRKVECLSRILSAEVEYLRECGWTPVIIPLTKTAPSKVLWIHANLGSDRFEHSVALSIQKRTDSALWGD